VPTPRSLTFATAAVLAAPALAWPFLAASPASAAPAGVTETAPVWQAHTSTAAGLVKQQITLALPTGWTMQLADRHPDYTDCVVVTNGFYARESATTISYTPTLGFLGAADPVTIELTDPAGEKRTTTYTPTVTRPAPPSLTDLTSAGRPGIEQSVQVPLPPGGGIGYVDADGKEVASPTSTHGEYSLAAISGVAAEEGRPFDPTLISAAGYVNFTPARGTAPGPVPPIRYRVTDAYGQTTIATYTPSVTGYPAK
jgi:CshA-type fibril repeat protein